jgi:hypothetical protein
MNGWRLRFHSFQHVLCSSSFILLAASSWNTPLSAMAQQIFSVFFRMDHYWQSSLKGFSTEGDKLLENSQNNRKAGRKT